MARVTINLTGKSPLLFGKPVQSTKEGQEKDGAFEDRVWKERAHQNPDGTLYIPAMAIKRMLESAAGHTGDKIKMKSWKGLFEAGVAVFEDGKLDASIGDIERFTLFVPSDGRSGGGKRVWKNFPMLRKWVLESSVIVLDARIDRDVFQRYLTHAGLFSGLGMWRPQRRGMYGRFDAEIVSWERDEFDAPEPVVEVKKKKSA